MSQLSLNSISLLREQLRSIREDSHCDKVQLADNFKLIEDTWNRIKIETENNERELINRLTVDHELELNDMRKSMLAKDDELAVIICDKNALQTKLTAAEAQIQHVHTQTDDEMRTLKVRLADLEKQINESEIDKEKAVNMIKDKLIREHKTEIESLRCRFKLMTTTERSPSDTSLEKIDRPDVLECERLQQQQYQQRANILASSPKSPGSGQSLYKRILDEKERQIDFLSGQIDVIKVENTKLKGIIQSITDNDQTENNVTKFKEQIEALQKDKDKLKQKLNIERSRRKDSSSIEKRLASFIFATNFNLNGSMGHLKQYANRTRTIDFFLFIS